MFITFEGGEGAGKSTQVRLLAESFARAALPVLTTREPGGSPGAEAIRKLVVETGGVAWHPTTEALLFMTARYDHLAATIMPALARGEAVICDRFFDSTLVYQGMVKQVGAAWLTQLYHLLYANVAPDLTVLLDLDPATGLTRAAGRGASAETRFEAMGLEFHTQLRQGFQALAREHPERIRVVDASRAPEILHREIIALVNQRFGLGLS